MLFFFLRKQGIKWLTLIKFRIYIISKEKRMYMGFSQLCLTLATSLTLALQAPLSMRFSRQEYWTELPFPSPGDLLNPGTEPAFPALR